MLRGGCAAMRIRAARRRIRSVPAYEASAAAVRSTLSDVRRRAGADARITYILRPAYPDLANGAVAAARALRASGLSGIAFYNYGHIALSALDRVRDGHDAFLGRSALVTGGGGGIGGAIAERLAFEGAAVGVLDRRGDAAADTAQRIEAAGARGIALTAEITDPDSVSAALETMTDAIGAPDVLVNNAAWALKGDLESTELADWQAELAIDLDGQFVCAKAVLPSMVARGAGAIVNIGSVNGLMALGNPAYSAAKAGLLSFTRSLAVEYGPKGIRANMVSPGTVETDIETWRIRREKNPQIFEQLARWYPVGRVGRPDDIAAAVAFVAADEAAFVNGANLVVDGGLTAGLPVMIEELILE